MASLGRLAIAAGLTTAVALGAVGYGVRHSQSVAGAVVNVGAELPQIEAAATHFKLEQVFARGPEILELQAAVPLSGEVIVRKPVAGTVLKRVPKIDPATLARATGGPFSFSIASYNVLGSQHSRPGGEAPRFADGRLRAAWSASIINARGLDVVGTQELQDDQLAVLTSNTGMGAYPGQAWGSVETDNSILYDDSKFEFVSGDRFYITFMGRSRPQPILKLRDRASGGEAYFINMHMSAGRTNAQSERERRGAGAAVVSVINGLRAEGVPVFLTGDMNDREDFFCQVATQTSMIAAQGGSGVGGVCRPPSDTRFVDWVLSTSDVALGGYGADTSGLIARTTDHPLITAGATVS